MSKYEIDIPDKLLIDAGGLLNEIAKRHKFLGGAHDKYTVPTGQTIPLLNEYMTMNDLLVICVQQSIDRFNEIMNVPAPTPKGSEA